MNLISNFTPSEITSEAKLRGLPERKIREWIEIGYLVKENGIIKTKPI
jgi:hypothetical protein